MLARQAKAACSGPVETTEHPVCLLQSQANGDLLGSRDTLREACGLGFISDGATWMLMIQDRNLTSHT